VIKMGKKTYKDRNGYVRFKDSKKFVHKWVVEKRIGRKMKFYEEVHHKNKNRSDNRPSNLWGFLGKFGRKKHRKLHKKRKKK